MQDRLDRRYPMTVVQQAGAYLNTHPALLARPLPTVQRALGTQIGIPFSKGMTHRARHEALRLQMKCWMETLPLQSSVSYRDLRQAFIESSGLRISASVFIRLYEALCNGDFHPTAL